MDRPILNQFRGNYNQINYYLQITLSQLNDQIRTFERSLGASPSGKLPDSRKKFFPNFNDQVFTKEIYFKSVKVLRSRISKVTVAVILPSLPKSFWKYVFPHNYDRPYPHKKNDQKVVGLWELIPVFRPPIKWIKINRIFWLGEWHSILPFSIIFEWWTANFNLIERPF